MADEGPAAVRFCGGFRETLHAGAGWTLEMDAGFSHQPEDLPTGRYAGVFGCRFMPGGSFSL